MFGLMKHFLKEKTHSQSQVELADMHVGCVVGLGFMPQKNISGRRLPVTEINSYLFEDDSFVVFRLESGNLDVNMIVAESEGLQGPYLALSQRIEERLISPLFSARHPRGWFALKEGDRIAVNRDILGVPQGWLVSRYKMIMSTKGRFLEGDFRLRKPSSYALLARPFDYVLLVDEANEYALEAELYEDGSCHVFSTVYRPSTDIGEITHPQFRPMESSQELSELKKKVFSEKIEHVPPVLITRSKMPDEAHTKKDVAKAFRENNTPEKLSSKKAGSVLPSPATAKIETAGPQTEDKAADVPKVIAADEKQAKSDKPASDTQKETVLAVASSTDVTQVHGKFGRIQPAGAQTAATAEAEMLSCDITLAGLIIEEAQRNQLLLSELIRKVIDLPARVQDRVLIPFSLSDAEYAELARRYGLQPSDRTGVMGRILEELRQFSGEKE